MLPCSISAAAMNIASLQKVALALAESQTLDSVLQIIVRSLAAQSDVALARVWLKRPGDSCAMCSLKSSCPDQDVCLHLAASAGNTLNPDLQERTAPNSWTRIDGDYRRIPLNGRLEIGHIGGTGRPALIQFQNEAGKKEWINEREWVEAQRVSSFAGQPLVFKGEILGVLGLFNRAHITDEEFAWLRTFADSAALAIANARASEKNRETVEDLHLQIEVLQNIPATAWTVTSNGQLDFVNRFYLDVMGQTLDTCSIPFDTWNESGSDLPPFLSSLHPDHKERVRKIFWEGIRSGQGWMFEAPFLHRSDGKYHWHIDRAVPLRDKQGNVIRFVGTCADINDLKQAERKNKTLLDISNLMVANLLEPALLTSICDALRQTVQFDAAGLALYLPEKDAFRRLAISGELVPDLFLRPGQKLDRKETRIGLVFDQRRPVVVHDLKQEKTYTDDLVLAAAGMRSRCIVPLISQGNSIGVLGLSSKIVGFYGEADTEFIAEVANQIALAVENMKAYEEIADLKARLERENTYFQEEIRKEHNFEEIIGNSPELLKLLDKVQSAAPTDANVLIFGETGSGKELIARAIHGRSNRKGRPLVKVNCAAMPAGLVESELFGHVKGAFTGASQNRVGRFELANGGTLFLDEIGEMPLETQVKLLRVLQERQFEPVGSNRTIKVDVRVIAATNRDLKKAVQAGQFRSDLYYRLNVIPLHVPTLRERRSDIPEMAMFFLEQSSKRIGKPAQAVSRDTMKLLVDYPWPGNIRELQNIIERGVVLSKGPVLNLGPDLLPVEEESDKPTMSEQASTFEFDSSASLEDVERQHILQVLKKTGWLISGPNGAAVILKLHPNTLRSRMSKLDIRRPGHDIS
ncbi:MAG: sigma 54-interacting transcriptional regulator [Acidobacteria bacterium]|nr:sigma 54-interacting transcriptional regulator [Acidobacteriota bacterium]